jgi:hypothetical protein
VSIDDGRERFEAAVKELRLSDHSRSAQQIFPLEWDEEGEPPGYVHPSTHWAWKLWLKAGVQSLRDSRVTVASSVPPPRRVARCAACHRHLTESGASSGIGYSESGEPLRLGHDCYLKVRDAAPEPLVGRGGQRIFLSARGLSVPASPGSGGATAAPPPPDPHPA